MDYNGRTFTNEAVTLDDNSFQNCVFNNVIFDYDGGRTSVTGSVISNYKLRLGPTLLGGLEFLRLFTHQFGPADVDAIVAIVTGILREPVPATDLVIRTHH